MDNEKQRHGLTGSTGALRVWGYLMKHINPERLKLEPPVSNKKFVFEWIDPETGFLSSKHCGGAVQLPFIQGTAPTQKSSCAGRSKWFNFFDYD
jgi:penicillin-binding protein 1B